MRQVRSMLRASAVMFLFLPCGAAIAQQSLPQGTDLAAPASGHDLGAGSSLHGMLLAGEVYRPDRSRIRSRGDQGSDGYDGPTKKWPTRDPGGSSENSIRFPKWPPSQPQDPVRIRRYPSGDPSRSRTIATPPTNRAPPQTKVLPNNDLPGQAPVGVRRNTPPDSKYFGLQDTARAGGSLPHGDEGETQEEYWEKVQKSYNGDPGFDQVEYPPPPGEIAPQPQPTAEPEKKEEKKQHFSDLEEEDPPVGTPTPTPSSTGQSGKQPTSKKKTDNPGKQQQTTKPGQGQNSDSQGKINGGRKNNTGGEIVFEDNKKKPSGPTVKWPEQFGSQNQNAGGTGTQLGETQPKWPQKFTQDKEKSDPSVPKSRWLDVKNHPPTQGTGFDPTPLPIYNKYHPDRPGQQTGDPSVIYESSTDDSYRPNPLNPQPGATSHTLGVGVNLPGLHDKKTLPRSGRSRSNSDIRSNPLKKPAETSPGASLNNQKKSRDLNAESPEQPRKKLSPEEKSEIIKRAFQEQGLFDPRPERKQPLPEEKTTQPEPANHESKTRVKIQRGNDFFSKHAPDSVWNSVASGVQTTFGAVETLAKGAQWLKTWGGLAEDPSRAKNPAIAPPANPTAPHTEQSSTEASPAKPPRVKLSPEERAKARAERKLQPFKLELELETYDDGLRN